MIEGRVVKISGPLVIAEGMREANMFDVVHVGEGKLIGEIIEIHGDRASIQVYEETAGLGRGEMVVSTGAPLSVELGPGIVTNIYDGIQRPLEKMKDICGANIKRGISIPALDRDRKWHFTATAKAGDQVTPGDILLPLRTRPRWCAIKKWCPSVFSARSKSFFPENILSRTRSV